MNALELAEWLNDYGSQYAGSTADKAADMLRRQHEAIKQLREALVVLSDGDIYLPPITRHIVLKALKDTEGLV